jgi:adenine-specific DNA-methyltransferase
MTSNDLLNLFKKKPLSFHHNSKSMIILGDAIENLSKIKDNQFNLIFADPPYNIGKIFGNSKENFSKNEYITWCKIWIDECFRVLKNNGVLCFMTSTQAMPYLDCYVDEKYHVVSRIIWYYDSSGVQAKKNFGSMYEPILIVSKDKKNYVFNTDDIMIEAKTGAVRKLMDYRKTPPQPYNTKKVPGNVWELPRIRFRMVEYETHPTQKPEKLMERIILTFSNKHDTVLDPFAGTFTTCAVSKKLERNTVGIEMEEEYYKIGLRRLNLADTFNGKKLVKDKRRVTKNKSKKDHLT